MRQRLRRAALLSTVIAVLFSGAASAHPEKREPETATPGRLPGRIDNVELVGKALVHDAAPMRVADVGAFGDYAYLGAFVGPDCENGGVYVIDVSDPANPREVREAFIPAARGSFVGEGVQILDMSTPAFTGQVLLHNNEICGEVGKGGLSLWDVTDPEAAKPLAENVGDTTGTPFDPEEPTPVHQIHSAFGWQDGDKAYAVIVDDEQMATFDIDIMDITDPRAPVLIAETGLVEFSEAEQEPSPHGRTPFFHDVVVKEVGSKMLMLASYWDAGWVILDVDDPANPRFMRDTDFPETEPLAGVLALEDGLVPEGNAHQAEFTRDNTMFFGTDEDFGPFRLTVQITDGPNAGGAFDAIEASDVPTLRDGRTIEGETAFVGDACGDTPTAPGANVIALVERGNCSFQDKADNVKAAGYAGGIMFGSQDPTCDVLVTMRITSELPFVFVRRTAGLNILGITSSDICTTPAPKAGALGQDVFASGVFDGWGYVHLYDAATMTEIDRYVIPESTSSEFADGFGDLSVHEVATDPNRDLAYFSYYAGGLRVVEYGPEGIREVGAYVDPELGNTFWGIQLHEIGGEQYALASDMNNGLWIFRYTG